MVSRRLLRVKVLHILYAHFKTREQSLEKSEKELMFSVQKSHELYHYLLLLGLDIVRFAESRIDLAKQKRIPTQEDLNPNTRFIDNRVFKQLENNIQLNTYINNHKLSWSDYPELVKKLYLEITESDIYNDYMNNEEDSYKSDKKIVFKIFEDFITNSESLYQILEEKSIFWNDDVEFIISMIIKTFRGLKEKDNEYFKLMPLFDNEEDKEFLKTLFRKTVLYYSEYENLIDKFTKNWDVDRIAYVDRLIMKMAITEFKDIPDVPIKVSLNEYIELSKYYSTKNSSGFINGILDKIIQELKKENKINKRGRGLMGEV